MSWTSQLWKREPILKAEKKPVKKKQLVRFKGPDGVISFIDQDVGEIHSKLKADFAKWTDTCKGLSNEDIGVVGSAATGSKGTPKGKKYFDTLYEHLDNHVTSAASRKGQEKRLFKEQLADFERILGGEDGLITEEDAEDMKEFTEKIRGFAGGKNDPKNIPFTVPASISAKEGGGFEVDEKTVVYGHYRTPKYVEMRTKVKESDNEMAAVPASWYGAENGNQTPPMHQAMFANSSVSKKGTLVKTGLLGLLETFDKQIEGAVIDEVIIDFATSGGGINMEKKAQQLADWKLFANYVRKIMKSTGTYGSGNASNKVIYSGGPSRILDNINAKPFNVNRLSSKFITAIGGFQDIVGHENIKQFRIKITRPLLFRVINKVMRERGDFEAPDGRLFYTPDDGGIKGVLRNWSNKIPEKLKPKPVKKSWVASLWS